MFLFPAVHITTKQGEPGLVSASDVTLGPLAKRLMHMVHLSENTSVVSKSSSDWLNYTGFPGDVCVTFFNAPLGNNDAVVPNSLAKEESRRVYNCYEKYVKYLKFAA